MRPTDVGVDNKKANPAVQDFLAQVRVWFRDYKIPDGKPANEFAFNDQYQSKVRAWARGDLRGGGGKGLCVCAVFGFLLPTSPRGGCVAARVGLAPLCMLLMCHCM